MARATNPAPSGGGGGRIARASDAPVAPTELLDGRWVTIGQGAATAAAVVGTKGIPSRARTRAVDVLPVPPAWVEAPNEADLVCHLVWMPDFLGTGPGAYGDFGGGNLASLVPSGGTGLFLPGYFGDGLTGLGGAFGGPGGHDFGRGPGSILVGMNTRPAGGGGGGRDSGTTGTGGGGGRDTTTSTGTGGDTTNPVPVPEPGAFALFLLALLLLAIASRRQRARKA